MRQLALEASRFHSLRSLCRTVDFYVPLLSPRFSAVRNETSRLDRLVARRTTARFLNTAFEQFLLSRMKQFKGDHFDRCRTCLRLKYHFSSCTDFEFLYVVM